MGIINSREEGHRWVSLIYKQIEYKSPRLGVEGAEEETHDLVNDNFPFSDNPHRVETEKHLLGLHIEFGVTQQIRKAGLFGLNKK